MERQKEKAKVVACIDADFLPFFTCYNKKDGSPKKTLEDCIKLTDDFIKNILFMVKADYYVGYLTVGKCFRYRINPAYKSNRKYLGLPDYIKEVKQHLIDRHNFTWNEEYEADDMVVSFKAQNPQYETIIVSPDKDILNLAGKSLNPKKMAFNEVSEEGEINYFWKSMISGDVVDSIKGLPGKGPAYFDKLLKSNENGDYYTDLILRAYIEHFGEREGIRQFYINYMSLKMVKDAILDGTKLNKVGELRD